MELGQIKYFILTAQLQNMSKAAQMLNVAQPTLSRSIASLEKELGTQLFDRSGKKLILNERGKLFLESAGSALIELENAAAAAKDRVADYTINVGLLCMSEKLIQCLGDFTHEHPELMLDISHIHSGGEYVDTNEFDVLLYPQDSLYHRYKGQYAYTERYLLAVRKDNPIAEMTEVNLPELHGQKFIFVRHGEYEGVYHRLRNIVKDKSGCSFCNSYELQRMMILSGQGIGLVPEGASGACRNEMVLIPVADKGFEQNVFIGFKREKHLSEYGRQIMEFISDYFKLDRQS